MDKFIFAGKEMNRVLECMNQIDEQILKISFDGKKPCLNGKAKKLDGGFDSFYDDNTGSRHLF